MSARSSRSRDSRSVTHCPLETSFMSAELIAFVDTNLLVYSVCSDDPQKHGVASKIVERGFQQGCYAVSTQVLFELYVTATRKVAIGLSHDEALRLVKALTSWRVVETTSELVLAALALAERYQISAWDGAIIEAARRAGCSLVLTEDLNHGQRYDGVEVENPFR